MSDLPENNHYIETPEALQTFLHHLPADGDTRVAIDTEADSLHSHKEKLCLIQFSSAGHHAIIDPLLIQNGGLELLVVLLDRSEVWMHGADFDMTMLKRRFERIPPRVYDTQTAARLCGTRQFGLAHLVEGVFGVVLSKQSQRANWGRRPLLDKMIEYALNDVRYILPLADHFMARLRELGREEWFFESCEDARKTVANRPPPDADNQWRVPGSGKLKPFGMAFLRSLWQWRDGEAERLDRPAFKIIGNQELITFAEVLQGGGDVRLPDRFPPPSVRRFQKAVKFAKTLPQDQWPKRRLGRRTERTQEADRLFDQLKQRRDKAAHDLDLDSALIASRSDLEMISLFPDTAAEYLLNWQRAILHL